MVKEIGIIELTPEIFLNDFKALLELSNEKIELLADTVNKDEDYGIEDDKTVRQLIKKIKISIEKCQSIIKICHYLHSESYENNIPINDLIIELKKFCKVKKIKEFDNKIEAIKKLLVVKDKYKKKIIRSIHARATLDSLKSVSAVHDIRSVFSEDNKSIDDFFPILILRLVLVNDHDKEKYLTFQLTEKKLDNIIETLNKYKKGFSTIKNNSFLKINFKDKGKNG